MKLYHILIVTMTLLTPLVAPCQYAPSEQGINSGQNYIDSPIDSVNTTNGNLVVHIPLISYKQRGTLPDFTLILRYNNKSWSRSEPYSSAGGTYYLWVYTGYGMQLIRGNALSGFSEAFPTPYGPAPPDAYIINGVIDDSGAQHIFYSTQAAAPYNIRTMDGSGVMGVVVYENSPVGQFLDRNGILHNETYADDFADGFYDTWTDPDGNTVVPVMINNSLDHWVDSIGRQIPAPAMGDLNPVLYPVGCRTYQYPSANSGTEPYTYCYQQHTVTSDFGYPSNTILDTTVLATMLSSVTLPDGTSYNFSYNSWGDLAQITLPKGGSINYQWKTLYVGVDSDNTTAERVIQSRTLNANDGTPARVWNYDFEVGSDPTDYFPVTVTDPAGNDTTYDGTLIVHYQGSVSAGHKLSTINQCLQGGSSTSIFSFAGAEFPQVPLKNPALSCGATTTLPDGSTSKVSITLDTPITVGDPFSQPNDGTASMPLGIPISTTVTDYGAGSPGPTLKTTTTQYQWQVNGNYLSANFMNLPYSKTVTDGNGTQLSQTIYCYDESGSSQSSCGSPQSTLGRLTSTHSWLNTAGGSISTSSVYNSQGMPTQMTDANGNTTAITSYQCSGLFPETIVTAYQSTTTMPETTKYGYDCNTGQVTSILDPNSQTTDYIYDPLGRITQASKAVGTPAESWVTYSYPSATQVNVARDEVTKGDGLLHGSYIYNGLGQLTRSIDSGGATTDITYDLDGRQASISNPYRSSSDPTYGITSNLYDALGRKTYECDQDNSSTATKVCTPQNSYRHWAYSGNSVTYTDETGHTWKRVRDALGRLTQVIEDAGNAKFETDYEYDALNNLLRVDQWGGASGNPGDRIRTFTYDSLSRLVCASNPENSSAQCPARAGAYTAGTTAYSYDANGNVISKTSPAPNGTSGTITTSYIYDALNRVLSKRSTDGAATPAACYQYDQSSQAGANGNTVGRLVNEWTQSASANNNTCAATMPPSGTTLLTSKSILSYDSMGRVKTEQSCVYPVCTTTMAQYPMSYNYDLVGNINSYTNGNDSILYTKTYDDAGQLSSITSTLTGPKYPSPLFSNPTYSPAGGLSGATYGTGTGIALCRWYDNRLRVTEETDTSGPVSGSSACSVEQPQ